jgi:hypothetical protein
VKAHSDLCASDVPIAIIQFAGPIYMPPSKSRCTLSCQSKPESPPEFEEEAPSLLIGVEAWLQCVQS